MSREQDVTGNQSDWLMIALASVGTAIIVTDAQARVVSMNPVAERLTGWPQNDAATQPLAAVFRSSSEQTHRAIIDPVSHVLATGEAARDDNTILFARDGTEWILNEAVAPIRDGSGTVVGSVLIFREVGERRRFERAAEDARVYAEGIVEAVREALVVLDADLRVRTANRSFYRTFRMTPTQVEGRFLFELGDRHWDIPRLRTLLTEVLSPHSPFDDFEIEREFSGVGRRVMSLNGRPIPPAAGRSGLILLAIEDVTERRRAADALKLSETRYRRLFETAQDGILIVDAETGRVYDANPFLTEILGFSHIELIGKELWEIGLFQDIKASKVAFKTLLERGYIRYEDLPLRTKDGRPIDVEFVSNVYLVGQDRVIQCNIRDVTDRKRAEDGLRAIHGQLEARVAERTAELARSNAALETEIARRERAEAARLELSRQLSTAQEDERRRIARELHDQLGQHLTALSLGLKLVRDTSPPPVQERLQQMQELTELIGREIHELALELRPTALDDLGLEAALQNYAEEWSERTGVELDYHVVSQVGTRLPTPVATALYRVALEALANVHRHAQATRVSVVLQRSDEHVSLVIEDNGTGFDPDAPAPAGAVTRLGLLGMRERVGLVGGTLTVEASPGKGTTIIARVPLADEGARSHA